LKTGGMPGQGNIVVQVTVVTTSSPQAEAQTQRGPDPAGILRSPAAPPWHQHVDPRRPWRSLWLHRHLLWQLTRRECWNRYAGSRLGLCWSLGSAALLLGVYTFAFGQVLQVRWGETRTATPLDYALTLFCGLAVFHAFTETLARAPRLIASSPSFVKKVVFPVEILPVVAVNGALIHALSSLAILGIASLCAGRGLGGHALLLPLVLVPFLWLLLGVSWFLAALGPFWRDLGPAVVLLGQMLLFLTPVFYPLDLVPEPWRQPLQWSPLAVLVENSRRLLLWDLPPTYPALLAAALCSLLVMQLGYACFMSRRGRFADVV
jgi:lipopolysaccharide transport system permease protein